MNITITDATPQEAIEIVYQLITSNAGLHVVSARKEANRDTYRVVLSGKPDYVGVSGEMETREQAVDALRFTAQVGVNL